MPRTTTKLVSLQKLAEDSSRAVPIVRLMMVANDLSTANEAMAKHTDETSSLRKDRDWGASLYFLRLQISHLFEGLSLVQEIRDTPELSALLRRCDKQTQESFEKLQEFLPGGSNHPRFNKIVARIRNNITFHYDQQGKVIAKAIQNLAANSSRPWAKTTRGDHVFKWRFNVSDRVIDTIICRDILGIPQGEPLREAANNNAEFLFGAFLLFLDFSGEFLWQYSIEI